VVQPTGDISYGYKPFSLVLDQLKLRPTDRELISQSLQSNEQISISAAPSHNKYIRLEDYIVEHLVDYDDISYDEHAEFIYDLASQAVNYFQETEEYSDNELHNIFFGFGKLIADNIHVQMAEHYEDNIHTQMAEHFEVSVTAGFIPLRDAAFSTALKEIQNVRNSVKNKADIRKMIFGGFEKCLYDVQKFDSDTERKFALVLERESIKWFKPVSKQFQIYYKDGPNQRDYMPDFVAEYDDRVLMIETKANRDMKDPLVKAKAEAAEQWCASASEYLTKNGGKSWEYKLIAHDDVYENMRLVN